jgi:hypothetical protein
MVDLLQQGKILVSTKVAGVVFDVFYSALNSGFCFIGTIIGS